MKIWILGFLFLALSIAPAAHTVAQTGAPINAKNMKDGVIRHNGNLYRIQNRQAQPLTETVTLAGGTQVQPDGTIIQKNGKKQKLREGYAVNASGNIVITKDDMFTSEAITSHARSTIGSTGTEFVTTNTGTTVIDSRTRQHWEKQIAQLEQRSQLMEQMLQLQEQKMKQMKTADTDKAQLDYYDQEISELNQGIERLNQQLSQLK